MPQVSFLKIFRRVFFLIFLTLITSVFTKVNAQEVQWGVVKSAENSQFLQVTGKIIPREGALSVESSRISGRIVNILKREGDLVKMREPLFVINSPECISLADEKRIAVRRGMKELIQSAARREEQLGIHIDGQCEILATHVGTLIKRQVEVGAAFNVGDALATIVDVRQLTVELEVPERDLEKVHSGQKVFVTTAAEPEKVIETQVGQRLPTIDAVTRTGKVRVIPFVLPTATNVDALVFAKIETQNEEKILQVPSSALVFDHNQQFIVKKNSPKPLAIPVRIISEANNLSSIRPENSNDLKEGDEIIVRGVLFIYSEIKGEGSRS